MSPEVIDPASFCYGVFAAAVVIGAVEWALYTYWPFKQDDGIRELARKKRSEAK